MQTANVTPITPLETQPILSQLLEANQQFALNGRGTTNHCPMALIALSQMQATPQRLQEFFAQWQTRFAFPAEAVAVQIEAMDWRRYAGQNEHFAALQSCFARRLAQEGTAAVLLDVCIGLPFAPATGAFHALIRLAYGLQQGHDSEIAAGLAALVAGYMSLPLPQVAGALAPESALALLARDVGGRSYAGPMITSQMRGVAADGDFLRNLAPLAGDNLLPQLAACAIRLYWQTRNFIALHMVTGLHAARIVSAHLPPDVAQALLLPLWSAFAAAYVAVGAPPLAAMPENRDEDAALEWDRLFAIAVHSDNDHVIKLTYSCWQESLYYGLPTAPLYYAAARRVLSAG